MAPSRRKGASKAAAAAAARRQWKVGDLVLAKVKGFPAWPATVSEPQKWGYSSDWKKVLVYFFGTKQIAFCNPADVEEFTEEKKESLLGKRQGRGADFVRAVQEIVDCYEKLKENNRVDQLSSGQAPAENATGGDLNASNITVPDVTHDSRLKSSTSSRAKDEPNLAVEDVGTLTEVESMNQRGASEEPADNAGPPCMPMPNTYTLRKKSRSSQPQRCSSQKKVSVQRSRSSLRFDSRGSQNGVLKCNDGRNSGEGSVNGFWDGPLRRAKRSKRSPEVSVPSIGGSPICNSNGTVEDNGSEINMAESETLSNNEGGAIESNRKREQSEVLLETCEGGLELSRRLDLQAKTAIVRKKRNTGRRRVMNDGLESTSRPDQEVNMDIGIQKYTSVLPSTCGNISDNHLKDEGDEHLPLVKRARVRMGKLLSEEQKQLDFLAKSDEKPLEPVPNSALREPNTYLNHEDVDSQKNVITLNESLACSPEDNHNQVPDNKPEPETGCSFTVIEPVACLPLDNCAQVPENKPQPWKAKTIQPFGCAFDGEAALPPSKRLHRALEAMSANAAEENQTSMEVSLSQKIDDEGRFPTNNEGHVPTNNEGHVPTTNEGHVPTNNEGHPITDNEGHHPVVNTCSEMLVQNEAVNNLTLQDESLDCNITSCDDCCGVLKKDSPPTCEITAKSSIRDMPMSDSSAQIVDSMKMGSPRDNDEKVVVSRENEDVSGSGGIGASDNVLQAQASQAMSTSIDGTEAMLGPMTTDLTHLTPEGFSKAGEEEELKTMPEDKLESAVHCESGTNPISSMEEALNVEHHDDTAEDLQDKETAHCTATESVKALVAENAQATSICEAVEKARHTATDVNMEVSSSALPNDAQLTSHGGSISDDPSHDQSDAHTTSSRSRTFPAEVNTQKHVSQPNDLKMALANKDVFRQSDYCAADANKLSHKHVSDDERKKLDAGMNHQAISGERINLAEVKAALASLELTLGSLTRTKESIGRATRIAVDCVKFGVAAEVVELLALYLEKESSMYKRVDLFFLVDSIAQCSRSLKGDIGGTYISAMKEALRRMLSAAAPTGQAGKENRRQCLKVLRLWLDRQMLPDSIILQHIRELESQNCSSSTGGYSRRMSRTERSFDDPLRDMEGMLVDEYGSNSSFQLPGFCMPRMLKEEDDGSDSDGGSFEAVTPEHDSGNKESCEATALPATEKHRHILEDVDGELEMEDVAPSCDVDMGPTATSGADDAALNAHSEEQFTSFVPPLPHDVPPRAPPLPTSPPPLPPPPPPPPPLVPHVSTMSHINVDSLLHVGRNSMQETMSTTRPPAPGIHHPMQMPESTSSSFNSYPLMHNPVAPGNNLQQADANMCGKNYNLRPPYPSPSNQFSYFQGDQQVRPQREAPPPPYYDRPHFGQNLEGGHFYGDQDNHRPPRHELTDGWGYSRPPFPGPVHSENDKAYPPMYPAPSCEPTRPPNHGWGFPPHPVHHRNHMPRPPCDDAVPVAVRAPGYWRPR